MDNVLRQLYLHRSTTASWLARSGEGKGGTDRWLCAPTLISYCQLNRVKDTRHKKKGCHKRTKSYAKIIEDALQGPFKGDRASARFNPALNELIASIMVCGRVCVLSVCA